MVSDQSTWNSNPAEGRALQISDVAMEKARQRKDIALLQPYAPRTRVSAADEVEKPDEKMHRAADEAQHHGDTDESNPDGEGAEVRDEGTADNTHWQAAVRVKAAEGASDGESRAQDVKQKTSGAMEESLENTKEPMFGRKA